MRMEISPDHETWGMGGGGGGVKEVGGGEKKRVNREKFFPRKLNVDLFALISIAVSSLLIAQYCIRFEEQREVV